MHLVYMIIYTHCIIINIPSWQDYLKNCPSTSNLYKMYDEDKDTLGRCRAVRAVVAHVRRVRGKGGRGLTSGRFPELHTVTEQDIQITYGIFDPR